MFQHVEGVTSAVSGYAGGAANTAHYEMVGTNTTGHAESVRVTFDPGRISYGRILQIYFSVAHDPTELNRQAPDVGAQYRSAIFPANPEQVRVAETYIAQLNQAHVFDAPIVTKVEPGREFYPAEDYHQDFLTRFENFKRLSPTSIARPLCSWPRQRRGTDRFDQESFVSRSPQCVPAWVHQRRAVEAVEPTHPQSGTVYCHQLDDRQGNRVRPHRCTQSKRPRGLARA